MPDQINNKSKQQKDYEYILDRIVSHYPNLLEIGSIIRNYSKFSFFNLNDILPYIKPTYVYPHAFFRKLNEGFFGIKKEIIDQIKEDYVKWLVSTRTITINDYLDLEKEIDDPNILKKLQTILIKGYLELLKEDKTTEKREEVERLITEKISILLRQSKTFDKQFLMRLLKHFGPAAYGRALSNIETNPHAQKLYHQQLFETLFNKDILSQHDLSLIILISKSRFQYSIFKQIIQKASDRGQEYLRTFLYWSAPREWFMLDENMQPMNEDYQNLSINDNSYVEVRHSSGQLTNSEIEKWQNIFNEFDIIPQWVN